jgi:Domain of unknown function (DUF222)/HNH endonuclease
MTAEELGEQAVPHLRVVRTEADELISQVAVLSGHIHAATAELTMLLGRLDTINGWVGAGLRSIGHWASIDLGINARSACAMARVGRQLADLPAIADAARSGVLGWDKVELVCRVVDPATETRWLDLARAMSVGQLRRLVSAYRRASADSAPGSVGERTDRRRGIWIFDEPDGLVRVTALLDPDDAAVLRAALAAHVELLWRDRAAASPTTEAHSARTTRANRDAAADHHKASHDDQPSGVPDAPAGPDTGAQPATPSEVDPTLAAAEPLAARRADALVSLLRTALAQPDLPDLADDSTKVLLHVDHDLLAGHTDVGRSHLAHGPSVPVATARRLCCDALVRPLVFGRDGQPLDLGRATRTVSRAQRRALRYRDGGCTFPGCEAKFFLDAHHVVHWADGGSTDLTNLALLCRHHHRLHHEGGYVIAMVDRRPRFYRPDGTEIRPPDPPPTDPDVLRQHNAATGVTITRWTAAARSGGAPHWSPQRALDALFTSRR